jgi:hypothetical protein
MGEAHLGPLPEGLKHCRLLPLLLLLAVFFVLEFAYPRFPHLDSEISRKSAGLNLSRGGAFAAPELEGFLHVDPPIERIYFVYPPPVDARDRVRMGGVRGLRRLDLSRPRPHRVRVGRCRRG